MMAAGKRKDLMQKGLSFFFLFIDILAVSKKILKFRPACTGMLTRLGTLLIRKGGCYFVMYNPSNYLFSLVFGLFILFTHYTFIYNLHTRQT